MNFFFDNNLSPYLARAIGALSEPDGIQVIHLRDKFAPSTPDIIWLAELAKEGGWAIISQDRLTRNQLEKEALRRSGLVAFILAKGSSSLREWDKAWRIVRWWPRILEQAELIAGGAAFEVPVRFVGKGKLQSIRL